MLRLQGNEVIYNNSENLGVVETLKYIGDGFSIILPDGSMIFIPEEDRTTSEAEVFAAYHAFYADTGGVLPEAPPSLDQLKHKKITEIQQACNAEILAGFESSAKGSPAIYGLDYKDQINMEALKNNVVQGLIPEGSLEYYAKGQPCEPWTNAQFLQLYQEAMEFKTVRIRRAKELIVRVGAAVMTEEIQAITW